ncbi:MAG: hypothetical protein AAF515_05475 [Pseudomonadota bacterium]
MELLTKIAWGLLAALHAMPALALFRPHLTQTLYDAEPGGTIGTLLSHRGAMFLTVVVVSIIALLHGPSRRLASVVVAISMLSFLFVYVRAGSPAGALQGIARADMIGLLPLALVIFDAWRGPAAH